MPEFIVKLGDQTLQTRQFEGTLLRIGRSRDNDIVLENLSVSREHAHIRFHDDQYILTDLNSANGTLVNGVKVTKTEIIDEDVITIGKHKLFFKNPPAVDISTQLDIPDPIRTVMVEPKAEAWITVDSGRLKDREFRITRFETTLGKAPTNDIVLTDDWLLGKKQAIILRKGNHAFEIQDLGGLRRVKVNGEAITERADIKDGDVIEMGGTKLKFHSNSSPSPTGRIPSELPIEPVQTPAQLALLAAARSHQALVSDESLDLEEGYKSVKITMKSKPNSAAGGFSTNKELPAVQLPAEAHADATPPFVPAAEVPAPEVITKPEEAQANLEEAAEPVSSSIEEPGSAAASVPPEEAIVYNEAPALAPAAVRNDVFEDQRSTTRRKRKHHQRASQKEPSSAGNQRAAALTAEVAPARPKAPSTQVHSAPVATDDKEVAMWEEALKNPSPAIQRQAIKMLKKLTGRDYDV